MNDPHEIRYAHTSYFSKDEVDILNQAIAASESTEPIYQTPQFLIFLKGTGETDFI
jgi:hypothetical protein